MLRDSGSGAADATSSEGRTGSPADRRRTKRRRLVSSRGALLITATSSHVVGVVDLSVGGAYVASRTSVSPGQPITLKFMLTGGSELSLSAEVVRLCSRKDAPDSYPPGIALRFVALEASVAERLALFVEEGRRRS